MSSTRSGSARHAVRRALVLSGRTALLTGLAVVASGGAASTAQAFKCQVAPSHAVTYAPSWLTVNQFFIPVPNVNPPFTVRASWADPNRCTNDPLTMTWTLYRVWSDRQVLVKREVRTGVPKNVAQIFSHTCTFDTWTTRNYRSEISMSSSNPDIIGTDVQTKSINWFTNCGG